MGHPAWAAWAAVHACGIVHVHLHALLCKSNSKQPAQSAPYVHADRVTHACNVCMHLAEKIQRGQATIGKYDGKHPSLTCATIAGKIFIHNPHEQGVGDTNVRFLNINKQITSVVAAQMLPSTNRDVLMVRGLLKLGRTLGVMHSGPRLGVVPTT